MKKIIYIGLLAITGLFLSQCTTDLQDNTEGAQEGGIITTGSSSLNYVVGNDGTYGFDMLVQQNSEFPVSQVNLYKSAQLNVDGENKLSNEILVETIDVGGVVPVTINSKEYAYADLIDGLTIDGAPLPATDGELTIGDKFIFTIESVMASGEKFQQAYKVNMTVSTRYAGTYTCVDMQYWRIGVQSPNYWLGHELVVKSIDAITYEYDWGSSIGWDGPLYFQVDADGNISYPAEWDGVAQTLNGNPLTTCATTPADLSNVPCAGSDIVVKDDVNGADQLIMTYGYFTAGSGPREFYDVLVKKVN